MHADSPCCFSRIDNPNTEISYPLALSGEYLPRLGPWPGDQHDLTSLWAGNDLKKAVPAVTWPGAKRWRCEPGNAAVF